jgi:hypothetical protein
MHKKFTTKVYHQGEKGTQRRNTITNLALREGYSPVPPSCAGRPALVVNILPLGFPLILCIEPKVRTNGFWSKISLPKV